ncbi:hypothetical protein PG994_007915 [Apiospora phragmitis]|uniref:Uncharacterized protein n=1 Tax=Apiospora phragmitis TaxID=2905665 RepID=A0ABR1UUL8_9PEZI
MSGTSSDQYGASPSGFGAFLCNCIFALFSSSLRSDPDNSPAPMPEKKYIHVPQNAAAGFLRTATSRQMRKNNEILV